MPTAKKTVGAANGRRSAKTSRSHRGQENGLMGRREGREGNRREANPDGSRNKKKS